MVPPLQVRKHCELAVTGEKDRLYGNEGVRDLRDLVGAAARVRQIGNDEPGHVGQGQNCPGAVLARWLVEVEQDRQVLVLAEFVTEGIKNCFALRREAAKDQDSFFTDGVDNVADFLIVKQEVDELSDLDVIDGTVLKRISAPIRRMSLFSAITHPLVGAKSSVESVT